VRSPAAEICLKYAARGRRRAWCSGVGDGAGAARSSLHRGARFYLPAFERKFTSAPVADGTPLPPAALHTLTQSPLALQNEDRVVSHHPSIMVTEQLLFTYVVHEKPFILHSWLCRPCEECTRSTWRPTH
jgi:hypothetical protein